MYNTCGDIPFFLLNRLSALKRSNARERRLSARETELCARAARLSAHQAAERPIE